MKFIIASIILVALFSCQKNKFRSCTSYNAVVGEWISIEKDYETKDLLKLTNKGVYQYDTAFGRGTKKKLSKCEEFDVLSSFGPNWRAIRIYSKEEYVQGESGRIIWLTADFDTIRLVVGEYNGIDGKIYKSFVRN